MIRHVWSVLAQKAIIESQTNSLSLIDVMEELTVGVNRKEPNSNKGLLLNIPITYEVVSYLIKEVKDEDTNPMMRIQIINPEGKVLKTFENAIAWEKGKARMRARANIIGLAVDLPGTYMFVLGLKDGRDKDFKTVAELPLDIKIVDGPPPAGAKVG